MGSQTGADDYLGKPYEPAYLIARARELVRSGADTAAAAETILVIDDSVTYRAALRDELERAGFAVVTASSGEEGLRVAAELLPAAIIVDGMLARGGWRFGDPPHPPRRGLARDAVPVANRL